MQDRADAPRRKNERSKKTPFAPKLRAFVQHSKLSLNEGTGQLSSLLATLRLDSSMDTRLHRM
jgi:hypothetical protein